MLVREKTGFYAGEIREFPSHIALELIRSGRGENPFAEVEDPKPEAELRPPVAAAAKQAKRGRNR